MNPYVIKINIFIIFVFVFHTPYYVNNNRFEYFKLLEYKYLLFKLFGTFVN